MINFKQFYNRAEFVQKLRTNWKYLIQLFPYNSFFWVGVYFVENKNIDFVN